MEKIGIGCAVMASGLSMRYGKNKLLEQIGGREVILHVTDCALAAGLQVTAATRSMEVKTLLDGCRCENIRCIVHDGPLKSDSIHAALEQMDPGLHGYMFMQADQPLLLPDTIKRLTAAFAENPDQPVRLGFGKTVGSPVIFPASLRTELLACHGEKGGREVLARQQTACRIIQAAYEWELWDVDTPQQMDKVRSVYRRVYGSVHD